MIKFLHEMYKMRDTHFTVPTFDFYFKFKIPEPNKNRKILERDELGRILSSAVSGNINT